MPDPITLRVNLVGGGTNSLMIRIPAGMSRPIDFYTSGTTAVAVSFTGASPFTDGSTSFSVDNTTGETKTVSPSASGHHPFTAGDRTGDIDITVQD